MRPVRHLAHILLTALLTCLALGATPTSALAQRSHTVRSGQSLSRIARRYRVSVWNLALANEMRPNRTLRPGQVLRVPSRTVVYVRPGQTLSHIARENECTVNDLARANRMRSTTSLRVGRRLVLPGHEEVASRPRDWGTPDEPGTVSLRRRDERQSVRLVDEGGRVPRSGLNALGLAMRRHEDDTVVQPHPRLARLLAAISDHFGGREVTVVSGFREAGGYTRESSRHVAGRATDIRVRGVSKRELWDFCRSLSHTGCGYYPRSSFVHVDVRDANNQWVDWSRPGQRSRYGTLRRPYRRRERRSSSRPRVTRRITRPDLVPAEVEVHEDVAPTAPTAPDVAPEPEPEPEFEHEREHALNPRD